MRIATYNVEWFNSLFDDRGRMLLDDDWSARYKVTRRQQLESLAIVFTALDADGVMVIEAPDNNRRHKTVPMLERFAAHFDLRCRKAVMGFASDTQQEIAFLYDPDKMSLRHAPKGDGDWPTPRFDQKYLIDLDVDGTRDKVTFSKPPLELALTAASGRKVRLIGVHLKTKAPHGATSPDDARRISISNRRKQLAECVWLRARIVEHLQLGDSLMVMGDLNDGPGLDEYEKLFGRSGVEVVLGTDGPAELRLFDPHAQSALSRKLVATPTSARFYLSHLGRYFSALLDYVMISPDLCTQNPAWRIWHPFDDPGCYKVPELREALLTASDHFPVSIDLDL
ncbi:MAG: endonuclease/exonuclease/phosphatase family protein [Paracoccaceae bacterium]